VGLLNIIAILETVKICVRDSKLMTVISELPLITATNQ